MIFNEGGMRRRSNDDLPIYQADGIYGRQRRSNYSNNINGENNNTIYIQPSDVYSEEGSSYDGSEYDDNNNRLIGSPYHRQQSKQHVILSILFICTIIGWLGGFYSPTEIITSSPLELMTKMIPRRLSIIGSSGRRRSKSSDDEDDESTEEEEDIGPRPSFVYEHPYVSSSYYTSTKSIQTLLATQNQQVIRNLRREAELAAGIEDTTPEIKTRLAIVRPFCEFDAEALPTTFTCWNALPPCKAAAGDIGDDEYDYNEEEDTMYEVDTGELMAYNKNSTAGRKLYEQAIGDRHLFDLVGSDAMKSANADVFLFYSQTFSENDVAIKAVDAIIDQFFEPGGWSQCFGNIYAIEANIPQELDLYIPSAQEELYSWVNGPNRQYEAAFRIIQSGEWGEYDGFYLMEGDSVPVKAHWLDVVLSEIEVNRPFAILGA